MGTNQYDKTKLIFQSVHNSIRAKYLFFMIFLLFVSFIAIDCSTEKSSFLPRPTVEPNPIKTKIITPLITNYQDIYTNPYAGPIPEGALARFGKGRIERLEFSKEGDYLRIGTTIGDYLYGTNNYQLKNYFKRDRKDEKIISQDDLYKITFSFENTISIWDSKLNTLIQSINMGDNQPIWDISPNRKHLVSSLDNNKIVFWDVKSGLKIREIIGHEDLITCLVISPNNRILASGSLDNTIILWDLANGKKINIITDHTGGINSLDFSKDGKYLVSGADDGSVVLWNPSNGRKIKEIIKRGPGDVSYNAHFTSDGNRIVINSCYGSLFYWDIKKGVFEKYPIDARDLISFYDFSPDNKTLLYFTFDDRIIILDLTNKKGAYSIKGTNGEITASALSPDGHRIASATSSDQITVWNNENGEPIFIPRPLNSYEFRMNSVVFCKDGKYLAAGGTNGLITIWDTTNWSILHEITGHDESVTGIAFSMNCELLISSSLDKTIRIWNVVSGKEKKSIDAKNYVTNLAITSDGKKIAGSTYDKSIFFWNLSDGKLINQINNLPNIPTNIAFSPDGKNLAIGLADETVILFDLINNRIEHKFNKSDLSGSEIAFSADGKWLATGADNGSIYLIDVVSKKKINTYFGHADSISDMAFSPDGNYLFSSSADGTIVIWSVK